MQGPYPKQELDVKEDTKSGTGVQECRIAVISDAFDRLRVASGNVSRTDCAQPSVVNALDWRVGVTNFANGPGYFARLTP
jgi:hypothetical protein